MNPFYQAMGPKQPMNFWQRFQQFRSEMQGKDPKAMLNDLVASGRVSQQQLDAAQRQVQQMQGMFDGMRGMFGK